MLRTIDISTSALVAQRHRLNTIAGNIAQASTTRDADGNPNPFRRRLVTFMAEEPTSESRGSRVEFEVEQDYRHPFRQVYNPAHPDADERGIVKYPNVDTIREFSNALLATRAYEANVAVIEMTRQMAEQSLQILT
ncbi:MAG: flagellar basal body rod protein FlgC [Planctomycetaceae bacterium]